METVHLDVCLADGEAPRLDPILGVVREHFSELRWTNYGPDSCYREIEIVRGDEHVRLRSWHSVFEENPVLVVGSHGVTALNGRSRAEYLAQDDPAYVAKRNAFDEIERLLMELLASDPAP